MSKVTIILPNYNHAAYLNKRIESILHQTYQDFEIILMDDFSTDKSREVLNQYLHHPKVCKVLFNTINSGSTFLQWQKGIDVAEGEYIWIAESDDYADELFLETLVARLEQYPQVGIAYCQSFRVDEHNTVICSCKDLYPSIACGKVFNGRDVVLNYMVGANLIPNASAVLFRKEIAKQIDSTYTQFKFSGDWWFWCELLLKSDIIHICEEMNYFRLHRNKVTVSAIKNGLGIIEGLHILKLLRQKANLPKEIYTNKTKNYANTFICSQSDQTEEAPLPAKVAAKILWQGFKANKLFIKRVIYLFLRKKLFKVGMIP
ncbi:glycosyltransferase family 2 protein [Rhodocytophaga aerolata]|uniref:Glycosyltransferase family 2 protein n=1 Tax=Rhodocytophaga aerolata TaxID=455078 RepID=A0ABT8RG08_9BACT|nr:glycosyltransferase family 2 protein [Rhodocytophaga aerolata]MDO1451020.1 glycosyltransferase family 2 protein [Rhodocytophaga aerolata]